jgi:hypothetical protein
MKISLVIDGQVVLDVNSRSVVSFLHDTPETSESHDFFRAIAGHPSSEVRERLANMSNLPEDVVRRLAEDTSLAVRRALIQQDSARKFLTEKQLLELAKLDVDCAEQIAVYINSFVLESAELSELLVTHPDPKVRLAFTRTSLTPRMLLRRLLKDPDSEVRNNAASMLK